LPLPLRVPPPPVAPLPPRRGGGVLLFPRRQPLLAFFAFVQRRQLLFRLVQTPFQLLVLPLGIGQRPHQPTPLRPDHLPAVDFRLHLHVQGEPLGDQLLASLRVRGGSGDLLQELSAFPDRPQQGATLLHRQLRLR